MNWVQSKKGAEKGRLEMPWESVRIVVNRMQPMSNSDLHHLKIRNHVSDASFTETAWGWMLVMLVLLTNQSYRLNQAARCCDHTECHLGGMQRVVTRMCIFPRSKRPWKKFFTRRRKLLFTLINFSVECLLAIFNGLKHKVMREKIVFFSTVFCTFCSRVLQSSYDDTLQSIERLQQRLSRRSYGGNFQ